MKKNRKQIVIGIIFVISIMTAMGFITVFGKDKKGQSTEETEITTEKSEEKPAAELGKKKSDIKEKETKNMSKNQMKKEEKKSKDKEKTSEAKKVEESTKKIKEQATEKKTEKETEKETNFAKANDNTEKTNNTEKSNNVEPPKNTENSTRQEIKSGHVHDFKPVYDTIHHDEEGYVERTHIQPWDEYVYEWHSYCTKCGLDLTENCGGATTSAGIDHLETHENGSSYQVKRSDVLQEVIHHEERVEEEYIVTQEAYDEEILVYYQCSCGEIKLEP